MFSSYSSVYNNVNGVDKLIKMHVVKPQYSQFDSYFCAAKMKFYVDISKIVWQIGSAVVK